MKSFYVTTPIYYVNDAPHIGHAYTTLLADVLARYHRLLEVPTFFLTGTDEHGQKVYDAANRLGISPQEQCDRTVVRFQELWKKLDITHDDFIRTTEARHKQVVQEILGELHARGEIYRGAYEGWYCVSEERFYTEGELVDGKSPEGRPVEKITEVNWFFRMSSYQQWLIDYIEAHPEFIQPDYRRNETLGFLRQPLGDLCISRPKKRMPWGIELPFDRDFVCYVWFDALVNYISAIGYKRDDENFRRWWPATVHLIGKDILTTHTVYWPTMLKAMGLAQPRSIFAHGWWLTGREKMSKSLGNVTSPMDMADKYGVDALRYFLMAEMTLGRDASFSEDAFITRYNADLANDLGNLASRSLRMVERNLGGRIPSRDPALESAPEEELRAACNQAIEAMKSHLEGMSLDRGLAEVMAAVRAANRYFNHHQPWKLVAEADKQPLLATALYNTLESLRVVSGLLYPVIPGKMGALRRAMGLPEERIVPSLEALRTWGGLEAGRPVAPLANLFPRIQRPGAPPAGKKQARPTPKKGGKTISFGHFSKLDLRVGRIVEASRIEGADRLLRLRVDLGEDAPRQVVAGIASHYDPADLIGRCVVVVANLQPAEIRGVRSEGMLLAATRGRRLRLVTPDAEVPPGTAVG
ncbi:MAG: methionine--tRNA ligase [Acidobacteriota bacterium]|nr:methionine--tRNA ligase [Acidobacteriota bacterium]